MQGTELYPPFSGKLVEGVFYKRGAANRVYDLEGSDQWVVRLVGSPGFDTQKEALDFYHMHENTLLGFRKRGINVPQFMIVIGDSPPSNPHFFRAGDKIAYIVAERIKGKRMDEVIRSGPGPEQDRALGQFAQVHKAVIKYWHDCWKTKSPVMGDIFAKLQYVYGKAKEDREDKLYLVDLEPDYHPQPEMMYLQWLSQLSDMRIIREKSQIEKLEVFLKDMEENRTLEEWDRERIRKIRVAQHIQPSA